MEIKITRQPVGRFYPTMGEQQIWPLHLIITCPLKGSPVVRSSLRPFPWDDAEVFHFILSFCSPSCAPMVTEHPTQVCFLGESVPVIIVRGVCCYSSLCNTTNCKSHVIHCSHHLGCWESNLESQTQSQHGGSYVFELELLWATLVF